MSRGCTLIQDTSPSISLPFPISHYPLPLATTYSPSFLAGPVTCSTCLSLHPEVNLALRALKFSQLSVTVTPTNVPSGTHPGSTFPLVDPGLSDPSSGVSTNSHLSSVAPDPAATPSASSSGSFSSSSKSSEASISGTSTTSHGLNSSATATGGNSVSQVTTSIDPPASSPFSLTSSLFTSIFSPLPPFSSATMSSSNPSTISSTHHSASPSPISIPPVPPITSLNISTSISTSSTSVSNTSTTSNSPSSLSTMTTTTLPQSTSLDPSPSLSSFTTPSTTEADPTSDVSTSTVDTIPESTITATRVFTSTLPGGRTTVVSTIVESRVLSTSDPVIGSRFSHNTGAIIGVAVSATVGLILSVLVVFLSCTRYRSREERNWRRRRRRPKGNWVAFGGRDDLPPIPAEPIPTSGNRNRRDRLDSIANIRTPSIEYEEDKVWRPPLADDDIGDEGVALGETVRGASPTGRGCGSGIGNVRHDATVGMEVGRSGLPTPPNSGEGSLGHSQRRGHTSNGHGYGHAHTHAVIHAPGGCGVGVESALMTLGPALPPPVVGSGTGVQGQTPHPVYRYLPVVGYPGPTYGLSNMPGEAPPVAGLGYAGVNREREAHAAPAGHDVEEALVSSDNGPESQRTQKHRSRSGEMVNGTGELVTPRTSEGEDLARSTAISEMGRTTPEAGLERGTGSRSSRGTTAKGESTSTRSRSLKEVLNRFRTLVPSVQVTTDARPSRRNSRDIPSSSASGGAGPVLGTANGGVEARPGYDYGAVVRPHQRQMVLERAFGHHQHMDAAGNGLSPPAPAILVNHAAGMHHPVVDAYALPELIVTSHPPAAAGLLQSETVTHVHAGGHVDGSPGPSHTLGRSVDEIDNEDDSLYARGNIVRDKLLDPYFLGPAGGSSPNIEGASLRDYVDYSRRIGGTVKNHLMSTTTFDTVDQDGASVSVGTLS